jgi:hypothetical protein
MFCLGALPTNLLRLRGTLRMPRVSGKPCLQAALQAAMLRGTLPLGAFQMWSKP